MRRHGFTLVEALISIAILAIVGTLVVGGFTQTFKNKNRVEQDIERYHIVRLALDRMARELSMAYVSAHVNPNPTLQRMLTAFVGDEERVDFTSFSHRRLMRDSHESDQNELGYFVAHHPDGSGRQVLARREQHRIDEDPRTGGKSMILVEDVEELELEYLDPTSGEWLRSWDSTQAAMQPNRLPSQVKIRLTVPHPRKERESLTLGTRTSLPLQFALNHAAYNP
ncbi:MAG: PulJ/GspJ family protein [Myxococcota bacterium]